MQKFWLTLLVFFLLFAQNASIVFATEAEFTQNRKNYLAALENYDKARNEYLTARNTYLKFKTLISKQDAFDKTRAYLTSINNLLKAYIITFRSKVEDVPGQDPKIKQVILNNLEKELIFLGDFQTTLNKTQLLEDFPKHAQTLAGRYAQLKQEIKKDTLLLKVAERRSIVAASIEIANQLQDQIESARIKGKNTKNIDRGPLEMRNLLDTAEQKVRFAQTAAEGANQGGVEGRLSETTELILQSYQFAREIIRGLL